MDDLNTTKDDGRDTPRKKRRKLFEKFMQSSTLPIFIVSIFGLAANIPRELLIKYSDYLLPIILVMLVGGAQAAFKYLQSSGTEPFRKITRYAELVEERLTLLEARTARMAGLTKEERQQIATTVETTVAGSLREDLAREWEEKYLEDALKTRHINNLRRLAEGVNSRLVDEVTALGKRANVNLVIGSFVSVAGLVALAWFVITASSEFQNEVSASAIAVRFGIRLSLVIFIQIFAYFFLRLYRYSIFEIKYFQNEITSAEFRIMAVELALATGDKDLVRKLGIEMGRAERNFILKKGETTLALARESLEQEFDRRVTPDLAAMVSRDTTKSPP